MAKTPHSSWNLSNMAASLSMQHTLQRAFPGASQRAHLAVNQCGSAIRNLQPVWNRHPDLGGLHAVSHGEHLRLLRLSRRNQDPGWPFVKEGHGQAAFLVQADARAHRAWPERTFRQR